MNPINLNFAFILRKIEKETGKVDKEKKKNLIFLSFLRLLLQQFFLCTVDNVNKEIAK